MLIFLPHTPYLWSVLILFELKLYKSTVLKVQIIERGKVTSDWAY